MKEKPFRIELKNPCNQNWDAMPLVNGGLYCGQCTKVVTDFTMMSDEALINFFSKKQVREVCGKFFQHQLAKVYVLEDYKPQRSYHTLKLLLTGLLTLRLSSEAQAESVQENTIQKTDQQKPVHTRSIKGKVIDRETHLGINARINLFADKSDETPIITVDTDSAGRYEILLPETGIHKFFKLVYSNENYLERMIVVDKSGIPVNLIVSLLRVITIEIVAPPYRAMGGIQLRTLPQEHVTGGVVENLIHTRRTPLHKHIWLKIKGAFRKIFQRNK